MCPAINVSSAAAAEAGSAYSSMSSSSLPSSQSGSIDTVADQANGHYRGSFHAPRAAQLHSAHISRGTRVEGGKDAAYQQQHHQQEYSYLSASDSHQRSPLYQQQQQQQQQQPLPSSFSVAAIPQNGKSAAAQQGYVSATQHSTRCTTETGASGCESYAAQQPQPGDWNTAGSGPSDHHRANGNALADPDTRRPLLLQKGWGAEHTDAAADQRSIKPKGPLHVVQPALLGPHSSVLNGNAICYVPLSSRDLPGVQHSGLRVMSYRGAAVAGGPLTTVDGQPGHSLHGGMQGLEDSLFSLAPSIKVLAVPNLPIQHMFDRSCEHL